MLGRLIVMSFNHREKNISPVFVSMFLCLYVCVFVCLSDSFNMLHVTVQPKPIYHFLHTISHVTI